MRVLVACEYSGRVREAFRARGHDAWSCDLLPAEDGSEFHIQEDALWVARQGRPCVADWLYAFTYYRPWDLMIAHPPCTHLAVSGSRWFGLKRASGDQQLAVDFFMAMTRVSVPRIAIENPVCIMSSVWREPDQVIQNRQFGLGETKATCLWLKGLPPLIPDGDGIADAMADQWGGRRE